MPVALRALCIRYAKARFFAVYCPVKEANRFIKKRFPRAAPAFLI